LKYFLALENATGEVATVGREKWFEVSDFAFASGTPTEGGLGVPVAATGVTGYNDISLNFSSEAALVAVVENLVNKGNHNHATLVGISDDGVSELFNLKLDDILVSQLLDKRRMVSRSVSTSASCRSRPRALARHCRILPPSPGISRRRRKAAAPPAVRRLSSPGLAPAMRPRNFSWR
jgi:Type VI secretion system effector, Hcp